MLMPGEKSVFDLNAVGVIYPGVFGDVYQQVDPPFFYKKLQEIGQLFGCA
jgi:hypothetical protein